MENRFDNVIANVRESDRELILGLAEGLPFREISQQIELTEMQVGNRIYWLRSHVFKVRTNAQLVAMAYHYGILKSPTDNSQAPIS